MKKVLKWIGIAFGIFLLIGIGIAIFGNKNTGTTSIVAMQSDSDLVNSLIAKMEANKEYKILSIVYRGDSSLIINISDKDPEFASSYFNDSFKLDSLPFIGEVVIYNKGKIETEYGQHSNAAYQKFKDAYFIGNQCQVIEDHIKAGMNDPNSYEFVSSKTEQLLDSNYTIEYTFRGKNAFGGVITNTDNFEITPAGQIVNE